MVSRPSSPAAPDVRRPLRKTAGRRRLCWAAALLAACAPYQPQPLEPEALVTARAARSPAAATDCVGRLDAATPWPPAVWDARSAGLLAMCAHPLVLQAVAEADAAQARARAAGALPPPVAGLGGERHTESGLDGSRRSLSLALDWLLQPFGQREAAVDGARLEAARAAVLADQARLRARTRARDAWVQRGQARQRLALARSTTELREAWVAALARREAAGFISRAELTLAAEALARDRLTQTEAESALQAAEDLVAATLGLSPPAVRLLVADDAGAAAVFDAAAAPLADATAALRRHPDMLLALADYALAENRVRQQVLRQYPELRAGPGLAWDRGDRVWRIGVGFPLTFLQDVRPFVAAAEADRTARAAAAAAVQERLLGELEAARGLVTLTQQQLGRADEVRERARQSLARAQRSFEAGAGDRVELLVARLEDTRAALLQVDARGRWLAALGRLDDAAAMPAFPHRTDLPAGAAAESKP